MQVISFLIFPNILFTLFLLFTFYFKKVYSTDGAPIIQNTFDIMLK